MPPHRHPGARVVLTVLSGAVEVRTGEGAPQTVRAAGVLTHDGEQSIGVLALESTQMLITVLNSPS